VEGWLANKGHFFVSVATTAVVTIRQPQISKQIMSVQGSTFAVIS
jgi:hypothetical protein